MSIEVKGVTKIYGRQLALNNVSFSAGAGEIVGFIGPNGAGKSTMMKIIAGIIPPTSGETLVCGQAINDSMPQHKASIGYLPENNPLYLNMYVKEYLAYVAGFYMPTGKTRASVTEAIERTGLGPEQHKQIAMLSKGYRQRVGLAQALLHNPQVLILDEPTTGLDPNQIVEIRDLIKETAKNKTILLSTHLMQEVEAICHRVIIIRKGEIVANGSPAEVKNLVIAKAVIHVEFGSELSEQQSDALGKLGKLAKVDAKNWLIEPFDNGDPRADIFNFAVQSNITVLSMQKRDNRLEEVFKELTEK